MVKILGWPHHFYFFAFIQTHLVHLQYLSHERACNLPGSFPVQKVSDVSVDVAQQRLFDGALVFVKILLFNSLIERNFPFGLNVEITHLPLKLLFQVQSSPKLLIAIIEALMVIFIWLH